MPEASKMPPQASKSSNSLAQSGSDKKEFNSLFFSGADDHPIGRL